MILTSWVSRSLVYVLVCVDFVLHFCSEGFPFYAKRLFNDIAMLVDLHPFSPCSFWQIVVLVFKEFSFQLLFCFLHCF